MKKRFLLFVVLVIIFVISLQVGFSQDAHIEMPPGRSYLVCWDGSVPQFVFIITGDDVFVDCPISSSGFLPLVRNDS